jgi:signal transduction histidine kinase/ligand-binding sensor domain-containing protein
MRTITIIFLLITFGHQTNAQSFTIYNYSVSEGLPSSEVYEIYQDRQGFLWFATDNGVVKFDGSQMENFHTKDGLADPVVFGFYEDHRNRLWFRTFSGKLAYYENGKIRKYAYNELLTKLNSSGIMNFLIDDQDALIFTIRRTFGKIDSLGNLTSTLVKDRGLYYKTVGNAFITGSSNGKHPMDTIIVDDKIFPIQVAESSYQNLVNCTIRWRNKLYFSIDQQVFEFDGEKITKTITCHSPVISLSKDKEDNLWIGYLNGGIHRYQQNDFKHFFSPAFLRAKSVTKVHQDHEGGYWFATLESGVFHVPNLLIEHFTLTSSSRVKGVVRLKNNVIVGDHAGKLIAINKNSKAVSLTKTVPPPVISLFASRDNKLWISSNHIQVCDTVLRPMKECPGTANDFWEDNEGNIWTVGSHHLRKFNSKGTQLEDKNRAPFRAIYLSDSLIYVAGRTGFQIITKGMNKVASPKDFADFKISDIQKFNDSTLLITTIGEGFVLFNTRSWNYKVYNSRNNFIADNIYSSLLNNSDLWLGTEKGLIKIPVTGLYKPGLFFEYLTKKSGLISDKIDFLLRIDSAIWAFTDNAFSIVPISFSKFANRQPLYYLQEIKVNDYVVRASAHDIILSPEENNIQLTFGFISFNNPNILLRYRLSASDNWVYTNTKRLVFSSLASGQYIFDVQYSTDNIQWKSVSPSLKFEIAQPWWNKWYIQLCALILLMIAGYWYFRFQQRIYKQRHRYLKIINEHQQKLIQSEIVTLERERNRIAKELHDRVGTNLTAIKLTVSQLLQLHKDPQAKDVEDQFQIAVREIKDIIYALAPPSLERYGLFTGLKNYVGKVNKNIPIRIALKTFGQEVNNFELNIIVFRIIQELLTNSIKHSFAHNISIHISAFADILNIMYEDDGVGFSYDPLQSGLGLDNIESRIHSVKGTFKFESGKFGVSYTIDIPITLNKEVV